MVNNRGIGVFDSGIGGLTVVREIMKRFPNEGIMYFGDTARVPYGGKSADVIRRYAMEDADFLMQHNVKLMVVACNSVSSIALDLLREHLPVPVVGMIHPGAMTAVQATRNRRVGVIGTRATVASRAYQQAINAIEPSIVVTSHACPLFVPLAEEGWGRRLVTRMVADEYLEPLKEQNIDTLILGCTHYPILHEVIQDSMGAGVVLVDSGQAAADEVESILREQELAAPVDAVPQHEFFVSDLPQKFQELAEIFLGHALPSVRLVAL